MEPKIFEVAVFHQNPKNHNVWSMCRLCLLSKRSFLSHLQVFLQKETKKRRKNIAKFKSWIFGLFWTVIASRLSGIDSSNISKHPRQKTKKRLKTGVWRVKVSWFDPRQSKWYIQAQSVTEARQSKNLTQIFDCRPSAADWAWLYHLDWRGSI